MNALASKVYKIFNRGLLIHPGTNGKAIVIKRGDTYTDVDTLLALLSVLPTTDPGVDGAIWNDNGVIKASVNN